MMIKNPFPLPIMHNLPNVLIIQFLRFEWDSQINNLKKIHTRVDFPITAFDISEFLNFQIDSKSPNRPDYTEPNSPNNHTHPLYDLYAVVSHHGTMSGGHYTAICRNSRDKKWRKFDDEHVSVLGGDDINESAIISKDSYWFWVFWGLLFF